MPVCENRGKDSPNELTIHNFSRRNNADGEPFKDRCPFTERSARF